jgi:hypothetical protein
MPKMPKIDVRLRRIDFIKKKASYAITFTY